MDAHGGGYRLPDELARHASKERFVPDELRGACRVAGEGLGREDARVARFRSAAEMVELWGALDLPARVAPYALRDARLGYIEGYAGRPRLRRALRRGDRPRRGSAVGRRVAGEARSGSSEGGRQAAVGR